MDSIYFHVVILSFLWHKEYRYCLSRQTHFNIFLLLSKEDESGNRIAWLIKDANNNYIAETRYTYRGSRLDSAELQDGAARKTGSISYSYNDVGTIQMQEHYNASGLLTWSEHFYWDEGLLQREERTLVID